MLSAPHYLAAVEPVHAVRHRDIPAGAAAHDIAAARQRTHHIPAAASADPVGPPRPAQPIRGRRAVVPGGRAGKAEVERPSAVGIR